MSWLRRLAVSGVERVTRLAPFQVALFTAVLAMMLLVLSFITGLHDFERPSDGRQVGYARSLNWAYGFILVVPSFYYFLLLAYRSVGDLPSSLESAGMLRRDAKTVQPNGASVVAARWTRIRSRNAIWWLAGTAFGVVVSIGEWWLYSGVALLAGRQPAEGEVDWSVKFLEGWPAWTNAAFSLLVFMQQALLVSGIVLLLYLAASFVQLVRESRRSSVSARLFPSTTYEPQDRRCGFQVFTTFFSYFLLAGVCLYAQLLLSRLWNVYLHLQDASVISIWGFLKGLVLEGMERAIEDFRNVGNLATRVVELLENLGVLDFSGLVVALTAVLLFLVSLCMLVVVLRDCAKSGRQELLDSPIRGVARERLSEMALWPLDYPKLTTLLSFCFLGVLGMLAYRVALLFLGLAAGIALVEALKNVLTGKS